MLARLTDVGMAALIKAAPAVLVLLVVHREALVNQRIAGRYASLDKSTGGDVIARLESRKLITRTRDAVDGRHKLKRSRHD